MESSLNLQSSLFQDKRMANLGFRTLQISADLVVLIAAFFGNACLYLIAIPAKDYLPLIAISIVINIGLLFIQNNYRHIWRYTHFKDIFHLLEICIVSNALTALVAIFTLNTFKHLSLLSQVGFWGTHALLSFNFLSANRILRKFLHDFQLSLAEQISARQKEAKNILLLGAGQIGTLTAKEIKLHVGTKVDIKGFIDDDPRKKNTIIFGIPVLGPVSLLPRLINELKIDELVIALGPHYNKQIRSIITLANSLSLKTRILPAYEDIISNKIQIKRIRDVQIEDLLQRAPIHLETVLLSELLKNRRILVTGAGGSIGSELVRQLCNFSPSKMILLDQSEFGLFSLSSELEKKKVPPYSLQIANICDREKIEKLFKEFQPEIVLHAAAYKHVALMEQNPTAAIHNNVIGTQILCDAAYRFGCKNFVLVSTDKAVKPTSIMGASKQLAEQILRKYNEQSQTRFCAVRFGNVLGSSGSVIPIFRQQIESGGPVTVTHPEMLRYFMTIPEACQLILQAASYATKENLFILDMGEPVKIVDLAIDMIRLSGLKPYEDIDIVFTGAKQGEKLTEILSHQEEEVTRTVHPRIYAGHLNKIEPRSLDGENIERLLHDILLTVDKNRLFIQNNQ